MYVNCVVILVSEENRNRSHNFRTFVLRKFGTVTFLERLPQSRVFFAFLVDQISSVSVHWTRVSVTVTTVVREMMNFAYGLIGSIKTYP